MCHRCVTESVAGRMLSRRAFLFRAPAAPQALAQGAQPVALL